MSLVTRSAIPRTKGTTQPLQLTEESKNPFTTVIVAARDLRLAILIRCAGYALTGIAILTSAWVMEEPAKTVLMWLGIAMVAGAVLWMAIDFFQVMRGGRKGLPRT